MAKELGKGKILLAEPFMMDTNFKRAVVLLCEHNEEGSLGFVLNKPIEDTTIDTLVQDFPEFEAPVFFGGPVQTDTIHYVHNNGELLEDSIKVAEGVYWGGNFEKLKFLISSKLILPKDIRFFIGYTGWSEGQLRNEMVYGSWVSASLDANYIFKLQSDKLWNKVMYNKGNPYTVIAQMPDAARWN